MAMRFLHVLVLTLCVCIAVSKRRLSNSDDREIPSNSSKPFSLSRVNSSSSPSGIFLGPGMWPDLPWPIHPLLLSAKTEVFEISGNNNGSSGQLDYDFYRESCPRAEQIVRDAVKDLYGAPPEVASILLRLVFHDCFIQGCDASVLLDSTEEIAPEKDSTPKETLRGFGLIDTIKSKLEEECPGIVSCADILVLAARDSVSLSGRKDSCLAFFDHAKKELHDHLSTLVASSLSQNFSSKEDIKEPVAKTTSRYLASQKLVMVMMVGTSVVVLYWVLKKYWHSICGGHEAQVPAAGQPEIELEQINNGEAVDVNDAVQAFPQYEYPVDEDIAIGERWKCGICLTEYIHGENVLVFPCKHMLHPVCAKGLIEHHHDCPYCRSSLGF